MKEYAGYANYLGYQTFYIRAMECGLPASTVKLTAPALDTCEGAWAKFASYEG